MDANTAIIMGNRDLIYLTPIVMAAVVLSLIYICVLQRKLIAEVQRTNTLLEKRNRS